MLNLPRIEVPLVSLEDGSVRIRNSTVPLESVISDFEGGVVAEEIMAKHEDLRLSDVYLVLAYYLKSRGEVEAYLTERSERRQRRAS